MKRGTPFAIDVLLDLLYSLEESEVDYPYYEEAREAAIADLKRALKKLGYKEDGITVLDDGAGSGSDEPGGGGGGPGTPPGP